MSGSGHSSDGCTYQLILATGLARMVRPMGYYTFPAVVDRKIGPRLAARGEVAPVRLLNGQPGLALTQWAARHGAVRLEWQRGNFNNDYLYGMIRHWVFQDQT